MAVKGTPDGYHSITPYLVVDGAARLIEFLTQAFGAEEILRMPGPGGLVGHAEVRIGDSVVMLGDARGEHRPTQAMLYLYVEDVDATYQIALSAGAEEMQPPTDQFYGDRSGGLRDPCGNVWYIATHIEDVAPEELKRHAQQAMQGAGGND
jgi:PhnB protein